MLSDVEVISCSVCYIHQRTCRTDCFFRKYFPRSRLEEYKKVRNFFIATELQKMIEECANDEVKDKLVEAIYSESAEWVKNPNRGSLSLCIDNQPELTQVRLKIMHHKQVVRQMGSTRRGINVTGFDYSVQENDGAMYYNQSLNQGQGMGYVSTLNNQMVSRNDDNVGYYGFNNQYANMQQQQQLAMINEGRNRVRNYGDSFQERNMEMDDQSLINRRFLPQRVGIGSSSGQGYRGEFQGIRDYGYSLQGSAMAMGDGELLNRRLLQQGMGNDGRANRGMVGGSGSLREQHVNMVTSNDDNNGYYGVNNQSVNMQHQSMIASTGRDAISSDYSVPENNEAMYYNQSINQGQGMGYALTSNNQMGARNDDMRNYGVNNQYVNMQQQQQLAMQSIMNEERNRVRNYGDSFQGGNMAMGDHLLTNQRLLQHGVGIGSSSRPGNWNWGEYQGIRNYGNSLQGSDVAMGDSELLHRRFLQLGRSNHGSRSSGMVRGSGNEREVPFMGNDEQLGELQRNHDGQVNEAQRNSNEQLREFQVRNVNEQSGEFQGRDGNEAQSSRRTETSTEERNAGPSS